LKRAKVNLPNTAAWFGATSESLMVAALENPTGNYGKCALKSNGKDTTDRTLKSPESFRKGVSDFSGGFPQRLLTSSRRKQKCRCAGQHGGESGTGKLSKFGEEHIRTGKPIVYTSMIRCFKSPRTATIPHPRTIRNLRVKSRAEF